MISDTLKAVLAEARLERQEFRERQARENEDILVLLAAVL